jgi:hypothetical protein
LKIVAAREEGDLGPWRPALRTAQMRSKTVAAREESDG